ncbi:MAG: hypothetical protein KJZ86_02795 [Caldilineaceae bacterium]|nr:hypothetical protein [Caldilineaceae bacterium]HRJ45301.1 hypothetical protein [Caldilineaceae bacterium]
MLINRRTFIAKQGKTAEVISMLTGGRGPDRVTRVYGPHYGRFNVVAFEMEFASMEDMERVWAEWFATPEAATFMSRWVEITESGGTNEIWTLE